MLNDIGINEKFANDLFTDLEMNKSELENLIKSSINERNSISEMFNEPSPINKALIGIKNNTTSYSNNINTNLTNLNTNLNTNLTTEKGCVNTNILSNTNTNTNTNPIINNTNTTVAKEMDQQQGILIFLFIF